MAAAILGSTPPTCGRRLFDKTAPRWVAAGVQVRQVVRGARPRGLPQARCTVGSAMLDGLIQVPGGNVAERLAVYANGYPARIQEALEEQFPAVAHLVGGGAFARLVHRYIAAVPLQSYNLNDAGAELPRFLRTDDLATALPFLPDLAQLESRICGAFHAADAPVIEPASLAHWTPEQWERAVLRFQPWVAVLESDWPVREIWEHRETAIEAIDIDLQHRSDRVLVRRSGDAVVCESLDGAEAGVLGALLAGQTLGGTLASVTARGGDPATVSAWFARWTAQRMITGCVLL
jgi:hypothetical protein